MIKLFIPMKNVGKQRPRITKSGTYTPKETVAAENMIAWNVRYHLQGKGIVEPTKECVCLSLMFYFLKSKQKYISRIDLDNLSKTVMDSLNGVAYVDDCQIIDLWATKEFGEEEGVGIVMREIKK